MASAKLAVRGMTCDHCRQTVENALRGVAGTFGAAVFLAEAEAEVDFDATKASRDDYVRAVAASGYSATPVA
ncbi:MAG TPA: cation transporter [Gemmatimonadales bacterium]